MGGKRGTERPSVGIAGQTIHSPLIIPAYHTSSQRAFMPPPYHGPLEKSSGRWPSVPHTFQIIILNLSLPTPTHRAPTAYACPETADFDPALTGSRLIPPRPIGEDGRVGADVEREG